MGRRITLMLLGFLLASSSVGCGTTTNDSPTTTTSAAKALFNPCTEIPDDALRAARVDPATEETGIGGVHQSGWEICSWKDPRGTSYSITVFSTARTAAEFEKKPGNVEFQDVTVAGREGRQFKVEGASKDLQCDVLFPASQGVVQLRIHNRAAILTGQSEDTCAILYRVGEALVPTFPH
ncbi:DUF3558 domain-containing protein [Nocardia amamiensis]|uniref:DUF3558 domain-containing protein n=1 Tax=Nocardia amamiensis TaxID=404578 RepID=UPI000ABE65D8|nr:DUF3558 domain-containing protein [Nocardia amamiensis]